jgi:hypothetical protein
MVGVGGALQHILEFYGCVGFEDHYFFSFMQTFHSLVFSV